MKHAMNCTRTLLLRSVAAALLVAALAGCDSFESINPFNNEKETTGIVEQIGDHSLTVDAISYAVTGDTEFEDDLSGLSDLAVGDEVEISYEESGGSRTAKEIGRGGGD